MAKGNMLQGQATGKVGDIVFMVRNGQQVARVYTSAGGRSGDQASIAVRRQRVRFGAASNQYLLYRNIVRGMYRTGKSTKQSDYNFFVRENVDLLPYLTREENAAGVKCAMPGTFSRGTLGSIASDISITQGADDEYTYKISVSGAYFGSQIWWDSTVGTLKTALKGLFPNARKFTYSCIHVVREELDLPSGSVYSHRFDRGDVVFDLYEEDTNVPDSGKIAEYFQYYGPKFYEASVFFDRHEDFMYQDGIFWAKTGDYIDAEDVNSLLVLCFATNDQVGDCYTSSLVSLNVPDSEGGLSLYASLRTDDHRQVAEDSYGYSTGVMRTNIQQS